MKRILYICPTAAVGGAELSLLDLIGRLPRDRFEPALLLPGDGPLARAGRDAGARVTAIPWPRPVMMAGRERSAANRLLAMTAPLLLVPSVARMARFIGRERIDLVHTNGTKAHLVGGLAARLAGVPVVWHLRDVLAPGPLRSLLRVLSRLIPRRVIANSMASAQTLSNRDRVTVVHNGIDAQLFRPVPGTSAVRAELGIPQTDYVVGTLGALAPLKGHVHLLRAMPRVLSSVPEARLLIVGGELYGTLGHTGHRELLVREAARLGVEGRVIFVGQRSDVVNLYNAMDVVVLASVRPESFGRIVIEAMACGRPVIASDLGGPREIITGPEVGALVPPGDPEAIARAVIAMHRDGSARAEMGRRGRARVMERFTLDRHVKEVCSIYDAVLRSSPGVVRRGNYGAMT